MILHYTLYNALYIKALSKAFIAVLFVVPFCFTICLFLFLMLLTFNFVVVDIVYISIIYAFTPLVL